MSELRTVPIPVAVLKRVWDFVERRPLDECWPWTRAVAQGYGRITDYVDGRTYTYLAHRAAYTAFNGPIRDNLTVDHICRNRSCCNPLHLRLLTNAENAGRNSYRLRTHCPAGHPLVEGNLVKGHGTRKCKTCHRDRERIRSRRVRAARKEGA